MNGLPRLFALTDTTQLVRTELLVRAERLAAAARPGTVALVLRDKQLAYPERHALGVALAAVARLHGQQLWVADRLDLALVLGAEGVHLGELSVEPAEARAFAERRGLPWRLSVACHDVDRLPLPAADAVLLSPVGAPRKGRPALGLDGLTAAVRRAGTQPLFALGGVDAELAAACLDVGAAGVAAIGAAFAEEPTALLRALAIGR